VKARLLACAAAGVACVFSLAAGAQTPGPGASPPYGAGPYANGFGGMVPSGQAIASTRAAGLQPLSRPALRGAFYYLRAINRRNIEVRVTVDARTGRIVSATQLAFDSPRAGAAPPPPPRYEPYVRGGGYSEEAPLPPGNVPVEGRPLPDRAPVAAAPPPPRRLAAPVPRSRPADSTAEVTGSLPAASAPVPAASAAKPAEPAPSVASQLPPKPEMVPIAPLE
jgi:hypothetical protein